MKYDSGRNGGTNNRGSSVLLMSKTGQDLNSFDNRQLLLRSRMAKDERTFRRKVESCSLLINQFVDLTHSLALSSFVRLFITLLYRIIMKCWLWWTAYNYNGGLRAAITYDDYNWITITTTMAWDAPSPRLYTRWRRARGWPHIQASICS